jgi:putative ABC transport system permease protein
MIEDARYAFRQLRKHLGFTTLAVLTLGLGIGAAAAVFGLIQGVLLSPPPYREADRLVLLAPERRDGQPYTQRPTTAQWIAWQASTQSLESSALYRWTFNFLVTPEGSESLGGMVVTRDYFQTLGLRPMRGRAFADADIARPNTPPTTIMLGYELWQRKFGGDPSIVGTTVRISRQPAPFEVIGVMPPGIRFLPDPANASEPNYDVNAYVDFWFCVEPDSSQTRARAWNVVGRLRPGATATQASADLAAIAVRQAQADPELSRLTARARPLLDDLNQEGRRLLVPLFGSVALVFFIACGNVAGLLLARGLQRHQEYAVRFALGAGRWRLFRQTLTESFAVAVTGAVVGAAVTAAAIRLFKAIGGYAIPRSDAVSAGWGVLAFGALAAVVAAAIAGMLPALRAASSDRLQGVEGARTSAGRAERRLLGGVATLQIVLTVALLAGAALLIRTAQNLARVRPGYDTENILTMTVTAVQQDTWKTFHVQALERIARLPGVTHTAFVWGLPLTGNKWTGDIDVLGEPGSPALADRVNVPLRAVTSDYFSAMSIQLVEGRAFRASDDTDTTPVAMVNQAFGRRYLGGANAVGKKFIFSGNPKRQVEIVGIVSDIRTEALSDGAEAEVYLPLWQSRAFSKHMIVRATSDPRALAPMIRRELQAVDPTAAVEHIKTMADVRRESVAPRTFAMQLLTAFSLVATLLALVGLYGVLSLSVASRTKELAVRKAIGAQRHAILRLILGEGARMIVVGVVIGTGLAVAGGRLLNTLLFDVRPADPLTLAGAALAFGLAAFLACCIPAWRAAKIDLMEALRHQ